VIKPKDPRELAESILTRSICSVQVGAVIADKFGILSWGWNNVGGPVEYGMCAERHAILRSNFERLRGATIYVAGRRKRNGKVVGCRPCPRCQSDIDRFGLRVRFRDGMGRWVGVT